MAASIAIGDGDSKRLTWDIILNSNTIQPVINYEFSAKVKMHSIDCSSVLT